MWDLRTNSLVFNKMTGEYPEVKFSTTSQYFVTECNNTDYNNKSTSDIKIWSINSLDIFAEFSNLLWDVTDYNFSSTGDTLAVGFSNVIYFINVQQKMIVDSLQLQQNDAPLTLFRYYNNYIITGGGEFFDYSTGIYNIGNKTRIRGYNNHVLSIDIDNSSEYIAMGGVSPGVSYLLMLHSNNFFSLIMDIPNEEDNHIRLYPNPANNMANLEYTITKATQVKIEIYNTIG